MAIDKSIYVVDDSTDYMFLVQKVFARILPNWPVRFFTGGDALYEYSQQPDAKRPSLILMDLNMPPGRSGHETLLVLRKNPDWRRIPVVIMSNTATDGELMQCIDAGANSCLIKPMGLDDMKWTFGSIHHYWLEMNRLPAYL